MVRLHLTSAGPSPDVERRSTEHGLLLEPDLERAVVQSEGVVIALSPAADPKTNDALIEQVLSKAMPECCCFVHGALASSLSAAKARVAKASSRQIRLLAGTSIAVTWRLPDIDLPQDTPLKQALIVVQGPSFAAELDALDGLLPLLERRRGGESGVHSVRLIRGADLWQAGHDNAWSWELLAAALSRSDSPQGDPALDGRTQDLVGLGLVPKLAKEPRGYLLEHRDGLHSIIFVLDGVVADYNFALEAQDGARFSAQLYRPPKPVQHQFSRLAAVIEDFFQTGTPAWSLQRCLLTAGLLEGFQKAGSSAPGSWETTDL